jgi:hypothetical protein
LEQRREDAIDLAIGLVWLAIGAATLLSAIAIAYIGARSGLTPIGDQWSYIDPREYLPHLLKLHNGAHPIAIGLLLFAVDYYLFDASGWFLQIVNFAALGAMAALFVLLARLGGLRSRASMSVVIGFATTMLFTPLGHTSLTSGFQGTFLMTFAASVGGAYALASYSDAPARWKLLLSLACSFLALISLANGVLISILLVGLALFLRLPRRIAVLHLLIALFAIPIFFAPWAEWAGSPSFFEPLPLLQWSLIYLGAPAGAVPAAVWPGAPALNPETWSLFAGLILAGLSAAFSIWVWVAKPRAPIFSALAILIIFIGLTAGLTSLGRIFLGMQGALGSRYMIAGGVLIVSIGLGLGLVLRGVEHGIVWRRALLIAGAAAAALVPISSFGVLREASDQYRAYVAAQTALIAHVDDPRAYRAGGFGRRDDVWPGSEALRTTRKWHFRDRWSHEIGMRANLMGVSDCSGALQIAGERQAAVRNYDRLEGWISGRMAARGRVIVVTDAEGKIVGYGRVFRDLSDLLGNFAFNPPRRAWSGHALTADAPLTAYLADDDTILCRLTSASAES